MKTIMTRRKQFLVCLVLLCVNSLLGQTQWNKNANNPVLVPGNPGNWDETAAVATTVLFHEGIYKMWYEGDGGIGYATSLDGLMWVKDSANPVLQPGPTGSWDEQQVNHASVLWKDGIYHLWYSGVDADDDNRIGHATSANGIFWTKDSANPVLDLAPPSNWDSFELIHPTVIFEDSLFKMWYNGHDGLTQRILYATSSDGTNWIRWTAFFMLEHGPPGSWDENELGPLSVLHLDSLYHMWYTGWDFNNNFQIGYATSLDGLTWTKDSANPVLSHGPVGEWDAVMIAVPVAKFENNFFKMWYGGFDGTNYQTGFATSNDTSTTAISQPRNKEIFPVGFKLYQNYPNPFNPETSIQYSVSSRQEVILTVYDLLERKVKTLVNERKAPGSYTVQWSGTNDAGQPVASGVYVYQIKSKGFSATRKMLLLK